MKKPTKPQSKAIVKKPTLPRATRATRLSEPTLKPFSFTGWGYKMPELGRAEARAKCEDDSADRFDQDGRSPEAEEARAQAAWWRALGTFPEADTEIPYLKTELDAIDAIDALLARAESHQAPVIPLAGLLRHLLAGLHALAAHGDKLAGGMLLNTVGEAVTQFEMLAWKKPELFREYARGSLAIPAMISRHPEKRADNQALLVKLEQGEGEDCPLGMVKTGKTWRVSSRANALAVRLQSYIAYLRGSYDIHKLEHSREGFKPPGWLEAAKKLKPFSPAEAPKWAAVAWTFFLDKGNHPALHDERTRISTPRQGAVKSDPAALKADSLKALKGAFKMIAGR